MLRLAVPVFFFLSARLRAFVYSSAIAPTGHAPAHVPQEIHVASSITYCPSPSAIAPTGHDPAHDPQEMQESEITNAMMIFPPLL